MIILAQTCVRWFTRSTTTGHLGVDFRALVHEEDTPCAVQTPLDSSAVPVRARSTVVSSRLAEVEYMAEYLFEHANDMEVQPLVI